MSDIEIVVEKQVTQKKKKVAPLKKKKRKNCRDQDSNLGYCGHNAMS